MGQHLLTSREAGWEWTAEPQGHISQEQSQGTAGRGQQETGRTHGILCLVLQAYDYMYDKTELAIQLGTNQVKLGRSEHDYWTAQSSAKAKS